MPVYEQIEERIHELIYYGLATPALIVLGVQSYATLRMECIQMWQAATAAEITGIYTGPVTYRGLRIVIVPVPEFVEIGTDSKGWQEAKAVLHNRELRHGPTQLREKL